jgi:hypothetical protein
MNSWDDVRSYAVTLICGILIGWLFGWIHAHGTVASECKKLGSFYVGEVVFECAKVEKKEGGK